MVSVRVPEWGSTEVDPSGSATGRKSVVSHHKSVGGRSQVYNDDRALVGVLRLECHADRHTTDMRGLPPSHVSHKSLS